MRQVLALAAVLALFGCGATVEPVDAGAVDAGTKDAGPPDAGTPDAGPTVFALTSTALAEGTVFPTRYTCTDATTTGRLSLPLAWTALPTARSYAVVMTDTNINLVHWVIWDIPASTVGLPEGVENVAMPTVPAGARQTTSYDNVTFGYRGPCPPTSHVYHFVLSALDVTSLPSVNASSTRAQVQSALVGHVVGTAGLSGSYGP